MSIVIVTGPPGAGKTTVSAHLARSVPLGVHLLSDQMFRWIVSGFIPPWEAGSNHQNRTIIAAIASTAARFDDGGYEVVVDGIIGPWFLGQWLAAAGPGRSVQYVIVRPSSAIAMSRATGRQSPEELVDPHPVAAMFEAFQDLGAFEANVVDSSDQAVDQTVEAVRHGLETAEFAITSDHHADIQRLARRFGTES
jgi:hypothetical protein